MCGDHAFEDAHYFYKFCHKSQRRSSARKYQSESSGGDHDLSVASGGDERNMTDATHHPEDMEGDAVPRISSAMSPDDPFLASPYGLPALLETDENDDLGSPLPSQHKSIVAKPAGPTAIPPAAPDLEQGGREGKTVKPGGSGQLSHVEYFLPLNDSADADEDSGALDEEEGRRPVERRPSSGLPANGTPPPPRPKTMTGDNIHHNQESCASSHLTDDDEEEGGGRPLASGSAIGGIGARVGFDGGVIATTSTTTGGVGGSGGGSSSSGGSTTSTEVEITNLDELGAIAQRDSDNDLEHDAAYLV